MGSIWFWKKRGILLSHNAFRYFRNKTFPSALTHKKYISALWTLKDTHPGCNASDEGGWWAAGGTGLLHHLDKPRLLLLSAAHRSALLLSSVTWSHHRACFAPFQIIVRQCKPRRKQSLFWAETGSFDSRNTNVHRSNLCRSPCHPRSSNPHFLLYNAYSNTVGSHNG